MHSYETIALNQNPNGILTLSLNRPDIRNAFNQKMIEELGRVFTHEVMQPEVKAVVFQGNGGMFCAGGDLNWMKRSIELSYEENLKDTTVLTKMFATLNECPKPVVGIVEGAAIGGGVGLVSICDVVLATKETVFSLSEVRLGIVPACIGPFVVAKIGASQARALFVSAERFKAQKAKEIGLVHEVFENRSELDAYLATLTKNLLECGPKAMMVAKSLVLDLTWPEKREHIADPIHYVSKTLAELRVGAEAQEGISAFLQKRKPSWIGGSK
jgi:methylglutaconyl-CoA hydratase